LRFRPEQVEKEVGDDHIETGFVRRSLAKVGME
jgi:hypothetical protein